MIKLVLLSYKQTRAKPGAALQTPLSFIHLFIHSLSHPFPSTDLQRRHARTVRDSTSSYIIGYFKVIKTFLNLRRHQNVITGSKVTTILVKG